MNKESLITGLLLLLATGCASRPHPAAFADWPAGTSPREIGKRVAERFADSPHLRTNLIVYPETCTWYGALTYARVAKDQELTKKLIARCEPLLTLPGSRLVPKPHHVDYSVFGVVPLEIYLETGDQRFLKLGLKSADAQWADPSPDGLTSQTRYWVDDMFMITALQVQAARATKDPKYLDRAALEMSAYLDKLQQTNGLFFHAPDVPFYWGRGDGWFAAGMAELLRTLPADHPRRARILEGYRKMMAALVRCQGQDGLWRQLLDHPEAWPETSCSGMFTFALATGVQNGWLEPGIYGEAARKGWLGLLQYLQADGDIREVCEGTSKKNDLDYYLNRKRRVGDLHGQAPLLWCATAFLR